MWTTVDFVNHKAVSSDPQRDRDSLRQTNYKYISFGLLSQSFLLRKWST